VLGRRQKFRSYFRHGTGEPQKFDALGPTLARIIGQQGDKFLAVALGMRVAARQCPAGRYRRSRGRGLRTQGLLRL
jgi:hypothetical protein